MEESLSVKAELMKTFPTIVDNIRVPRARRVFAQTKQERLTEVIDYAVKKMGFSILCTITGLDNVTSFEVIYHLARPSGSTLNLSALLPKDHSVIRTITCLFPAAEMYERELMDLLGIQVEGLPPGSRYPLPDNWPVGAYPLRKDWKFNETFPNETVTQEENHA